jgi:TPR repeat protein
MVRTILLAIVVVATAASSFGQARRYTQRIAPLVRPAPPTYQQQQQQQQGTQTQTQQPQQQTTPPPPPPQSYPQYQYAPTTTAHPVDPAKAAAEKAKNEEKQFEYFKKRAEEGSDHAQFELGLRYLSGKGTAPDEKLAKEWFAKAAKNGNSQAAKKLTELGGEPEKAETIALPDPSLAKAADPKPAPAK